MLTLYMIVQYTWLCSCGILTILGESRFKPYTQILYHFGRIITYSISKYGRSYDHHVLVYFSCVKFSIFPLVLILNHVQFFYVVKSLLHSYSCVYQKSESAV